MTIRDLGAVAPDSGQDVQILRRYLEQFRTISIINGQMVSGVIPAGGSTVIIRHSLYRPYLGGLIAGVSDGAPVLVQTPEVARLSVDIGKNVVVGSPTPLAVDTTINVWVF